MVSNALGHALGRSAHNVVGKAGRALRSEAKLPLDAGVSAVVLGEAAGGTLVKFAVEGIPLLLEGGEVLGGVAANVVVSSIGDDGNGDEGKKAERELHWWWWWWWRKTLIKIIRKIIKR